MPALIACPVCNETGCDKCDQSGRFTLESCPNRFIGNEMHEVIQMADDYKAGHSPIVGGVLDQSASFIAACRFLASEDNRATAERNK